MKIVRNTQATLPDSVATRKSPNVITDTSSDNGLSGGNDTLADTLIGALGNETYSFRTVVR